MLKGKKGLCTSGWRRELSPNPGLFFPWVRVPRAPSPSARGVSLLPCYFNPLLGRPLSGKKHTGKKCAANPGEKTSVLLEILNSRVRCTDRNCKQQNIFRNGTTCQRVKERYGFLQKFKKKWYKSTADNQDLNKYYTHDALLLILHPERWITKKDAAQNF